MANTLIQIKRTSVSGRAANSTTLANPGELALNMTDGIMYSTNGSTIFEIGANNTSAHVSNTFYVGNGTVNVAVNSTYVSTSQGLVLNPQATAPANTSPGSVYYDANNHVFSFYTDQASPHQSDQQIFVRVVNKTASTLTKGQAVYITGAFNNRPTVDLAIANSISKHDSIGLIYDNIDVDNEGFVLFGGLFKGYNTSTFNPGDVLYLSTTVAGELTTTKPDANDGFYAVGMGHALNNVVSGDIFLSISNEYNSGQPNTKIAVSDGYRLTYSSNFSYDYLGDKLTIGNSTVNSTSNSTTIGTTLLTGNVSAGYVNVSGQVNAATANIGSAVINATGIYIGGLVNATAFNVDGSFTANSTLVNAAALNVTGQVNTATLYATTSANVGTYLTVNSTQTTITTNTQLYGIIANSTIGTYGQYLTSNGSSTFWNSPLLTQLTDTNVGGPTAGQVLTYSTALNKWINQDPPTTPPVYTAGYYGSFYSNVATQNAAASNTATLLTYNGTFLNNGVTIGTNNDITFAYSGIYELIFSIQFVSSSNKNENIIIWLRKNGSDIAESASDFGIYPVSGGTNGRLIAVTPYIEQVNAGDKIQIMWATTSSTAVNIQSIAATAFAPETPGVILTVKPVSNIITAPAGANTQIQFNDNGLTNASSGFTFDKTTNTLSVGNTILVGKTVNAESFTIDGFFTSNSTGLYHTGTINAASLTTDGTFLANSTGTYVNALVSVGNSTVNTTIEPTHLVLGGVVTANGGNGSPGQVLTSNGTGTYWSTVTGGSGSVNTDAAYVWTNVQTFNANVLVNTATFTVGNSTSNTSANTTQLRVANSSGSVNVSPLAITIGTTIIEPSQINVSILNTSGNVTVGQDMVVTGNLLVNGTTVTINTATLDVTDKNITIAKGTATAALANGAGITVDGAGVSLEYHYDTNNWFSNTGITVGNSTVNTTINGTSFTGQSNDTIYAYGKTEGNLNVNSSLTSNNSTYAYGKTENALNVNSATSALTSNNSTYAFGKTEGALNVNSALTANDSAYLGGVLAASYVQNTDSRALSGNLTFTGNEHTINGSNTYITANVTMTANLNANVLYASSNVSTNTVFATNVNATTVTANTTGIHTGNVSASVVNASANVFTNTVFATNVNATVVTANVTGILTGNVSATVVNASANVFTNTVFATNVNATTVNASANVITTNVYATTVTANTTGIHTGNVSASVVNASANVFTNTVFATNVNATTVTANVTGILTGNVSATVVNASANVFTNTVFATNVNATTVTANVTGILTGNVSASVVNASANVFTNTVFATNVNATNLSGNLTGNVAAVVVNATANVFTNTVFATNVNATTVNTVTVQGSSFSVNNSLANVQALNVVGQVNTATFYATTSANIASAVQANSTGLFATTVTANLVGTANNANNLGGVAAANYVQNTDSRVLSGNLNFTGANVFYDSAITLKNNAQLKFRALSGNDVQFKQQNDDNFVFYSTNDAGAARAVWSIAANSATSALTVSVPATFTGANVRLSIGTALYANGSPGTSGQVLTSNGTTVFWSSDLVASTVNATSVNSATVNATTSIVVGSNVLVNTSVLSIGNSTINATMNSVYFSTGSMNANVRVNIEGSLADLVMSDVANTADTSRSARIYTKNFVGNNLVTIIFGRGLSNTQNIINYGGGTTLAEPVTEHRWFTNAISIGTTGNTGTARMVLVGANVGIGIGVASPDSTLQVSGTANISGNVAIGGILKQNGISTRVVNYASGTTLTINTDTTDVANTYNTEAAGTLTMAIPTGTPTDGQKLLVVIRSTNVQTFSWTTTGANSFDGSDDLPLPTATSGSSKYDYLGFIYASATQRWRLLAKNFGF